jgi:hypothetical protein
MSLGSQGSSIEVYLFFIKELCSGELGIYVPNDGLNIQNSIIVLECPHGKRIIKVN